MKTFRRISIPIAGSVIIIFSCLSQPVLATEYPGSFVEWTNFGTYTRGLNVPDTGPVTSVSLFVRSAQTQLGFDNNAMLLTSPLGTTIYLFDLSAYKITGTSLYLTRFIDTAPIIITEGVPPYAGSFRPGESFSNFNGEWMTGTWTLAVYNNRPGTGNTGAVTDWSLIINQATPIPTPSPIVPTPSPVPIVYREYPGAWFSWTGVSTTLSYISIGNQGIITDVNVNMNANCTSSLDPLGMYLISPDDTIVALFNKHQLKESTLYLTTFDDAADQSILSGIAPYLGLYRPVESLALFNNETVTGDWRLVAYNDDAANNGTVSDWSLVIGIRDFVPSPTPTVTPTPTSTPSVTPTPTMTPTPSTTPTVTPTPTMTPTPSTTPTVTPTPTMTPTMTPIPTPTPPAGYCPASFGDAFTAPGQQVTWCPIAAPITGGRVKKVTLKVKNFDITEGGDLDNVGMFLVSPNDTVVTLFAKHSLSEHSLAATWFDDSAPYGIAEGLGPYIGRWKPTGPGHLYDFYGEDIAGTWHLVIFNDYYCEPQPSPAPPCQDWALLKKDWELEICPLPTRTPTPTPGVPTPTPTQTPWPPLPPSPTAPPPVCKDYNGGSFAWSDIGTFTDTVTISDHGAVSNVTVQITAKCSGDLDDIGIYLRSPEGTDVCFFAKHQLKEHALYKTIFDDDAFKIITDKSNVAPYLGSYRPAGPVTLSKLNGESINGVWTLLVYNDLAGNTGEVIEWILIVCKVPTPAPTPQDTPTPAPPAGSTPIPILESGDYDGDGTSDIGIFRPAMGQWSVRNVGTSFFGKTGDLPASGDYDGDGTTDLAIFRSSNGLWAIYDITRTYFGRGGISIPGDYDGDGIADIGIFRSSSGLWAIRGMTRRYFGRSGDYPVPADYDGDWATDIAVFRPSSGLWAVRSVTRAYFGAQSDLPFPADYLGNGTDYPAIFRSGLWAIRGVSRFYFGKSGDYPVPADYCGDGTDYPGIFRGASGLWAIRAPCWTRAYYGRSGDIPIAR